MRYFIKAYNHALKISEVDSVHDTIESAEERLMSVLFDAHNKGWMVALCSLPESYPTYTESRLVFEQDSGAGQ